MSVSRTSSPDLVPVNMDDRAVSPLILDENDALVGAIQQVALEVIHSPTFLPLAPPNDLLEALNLEPLHIGGEQPHMEEWVLHFADENNAHQVAAQNIGVFLNHLLVSSTQLPDQALGA